MNFPQQQPDIHLPFTPSKVPSYDVAYTSSDPTAYACNDTTGTWGYYASVEEASLYPRMQLDLELMNNYLAADPSAASMCAEPYSSCYQDASIPPSGHYPVGLYPETYPPSSQVFQDASIFSSDTSLAFGYCSDVAAYATEGSTVPHSSSPITFHPFDHIHTTSGKAQKSFNRVACVAPNLIRSTIATVYPSAYASAPSVSGDAAGFSSSPLLFPPYPSSVSSSPTPPEPRSELITYQRRNVQVSRAAARVSASQSLADRWKCPHCPHVQKNRRKPDLRRHVQTHTADAVWVCCGVPLVEAAACGVPEDVMSGEVREFEGIFMVGGCRKTFSRRDAYGRHLKRRKDICFGDPQAVYQPGNSLDESV